MSSRRRARHVAQRWGTALLFGVVASCRSADEPELDRTPPAVPDLQRLVAGVPDAGGLSLITGAAGAVESNADVEVRESGVPAPQTARSRAGSDGSFAVTIHASLQQVLEVVAIDAAGNASWAVLLAVGAPYAIERQGSAEPTLAAGDSLAEPLTVVVRDESGELATGVPVVLSGSAFAAVSATTDAAGTATWALGSWTQAGDFGLEAALDDAFVATPAAWTLHVDPGPPSALEEFAGSEQVAAPGQLLPEGIVARIVDEFANPIAGLTVDWAATAGSPSASTTSTDVAGLATVQWTLPPTNGEFELVATHATLAPARFVGVAGPPPVVSSYTPDPATPGASVTIQGSGFSRAPEYDAVLFPGPGGSVAGAVLEATPSQLVVQVPFGTTAGELQVQVSGRDASPVSFRIENELAQPVEVPVGSGSLRLETPTGNEEFILALYSDPGSSASFTVGSAPAAPKRLATAAAADAASDFHTWLRQQERRSASKPVARRAALAKPVQQAEFTVLASLSGGQYDQVTATLRYQGSRSLLYVDDRVQANELSDTDAQNLGSRFNSESYWAVRNAFAAESDIDGNGTITVLLTPTVNMLTPPGSGAFVGGFFFAQDLHNVSNSNRMEILYGMVPDPSGRWGNQFPVASTLDVLDSVLPHEQQHLVNYNQHALVRSGAPEELWLNEGLSHLAEHLAGFPEQNVLRSNLFLAAPYQVSMTAGGNALDERGMNFLFARYLADREDSGFLQRIVETSRVGVDNIENATGGDFVDWFGDWVATLYLDHSDLTVPSTYRYDSIDFASDFDAPQVDTLSLEDPQASASLPPASLRFYRLAGTGAEATELEVSGGARAVVIRIR